MSVVLAPVATSAVVVGEDFKMGMGKAIAAIPARRGDIADTALSWQNVTKKADFHRRTRGEDLEPSVGLRAKFGLLVSLCE